MYCDVGIHFGEVGIRVKALLFLLNTQNRRKL